MVLSSMRCLQYLFLHLHLSQSSKLPSLRYTGLHSFYLQSFDGTSDSKVGRSTRDYSEDPCYFCGACQSAEVFGFVASTTFWASAGQRYQPNLSVLWKANDGSAFLSLEMTSRWLARWRTFGLYPLWLDSLSIGRTRMSPLHVKPLYWEPRRLCSPVHISSTSV